MVRCMQTAIVKKLENGIISITTGSITTADCDEMEDPGMRERRGPAPSDHLVCLLDVMGFTNLLKEGGEKEDPREELRRVYDSMWRICIDTREFLAKKSRFDGRPIRSEFFEGVAVIDNVQDFGTGNIDQDQYKDEYRKMVRSIKFFSDTIMVYAEVNPSAEERPAQLLAFCDIIGMYVKLCALHQRDKSQMHLLLRGGISVGTAVMDERTGIYIGQPIVDANSVEKGSNWMGVAFHEDANELIEECAVRSSILVGFNRPIYPYLVPPNIRADGKNEFAASKYAINWVQCHPADPNRVPEVARSPRPRPIFRDLIEGNLAKYPWEGIGNPKEKDKMGERMELTIKFAMSILREYEDSKDYRIG